MILFVWRGEYVWRNSDFNWAKLETFWINVDSADLILLIKKKKAIKNHFHFYFILLISFLRVSGAI